MTTQDQFYKLITLVTMGLTGKVMNYSYKGMKLGRLIFIINYIGFAGKCTIADLIDFLNINPSTATRQLDKLAEEYQLVKREISSSDRRLIELKLTELGWEVYKHHKKMGEVPAKMILEKFNKEEQLVLKQALTFILKSFNINIKKTIKK
jgi:DNA-binding MarR family transcriptional regulator